MFCVNCGAEITDNSNYCSNCGQDLNKYQEKTPIIEMKHSKNELMKNDLMKVLHEPVAPYFSNTINILNQLVEGLVLAAIFYVLAINWGQLTLPIVLNIIYCVGLVIVIWYNNVILQQYVTWASPFETLFQIVWGIFQCVLVLAAAQPIYIFTLLIIPIKIMIVLLLWNLNHKNKDPQALKIWNEHYKAFGSQFAQDMFDEFKKFGNTQMRTTSYVIIIIIGLLTLFNYFAPIDSAIKTYISFIILLIFLIMSTYFNLNHFFNNSEKLKKYGYKW